MQRLWGSLGGGVQGGFDVLLELVEAEAEGLAGFGWGRLEPGVGDEFEAALLATEPVEAEGFGVEGSAGGADLFGEGGEGLVEGGFIVGGEMGDGVCHSFRQTVECSEAKLSFESCVVRKQSRVELERLDTFQGNVIREACFSRVENNIPNRNNYGWKGNGERVIPRTSQTVEKWESGSSLG